MTPTHDPIVKHVLNALIFNYLFVFTILTAFIPLETDFLHFSSYAMFSS